ncbi:hypothetical protein Plhal304r1_c041g0119861 [Plasmopara halstedii]
MVFTVCELRNFLAEFVVCMLVGSQLSFARVLHGQQKKSFNRAQFRQHRIVQ